MLKFTIKAIAILGLAGLTTGCLEHRYNITALPNREVDVDYELRGDRVDIEDGLELLPDSVKWSLKRTIEESEDKTTHIINGQVKLHDPSELSHSLDWMKSPADSIYFVPDVNLTAKRLPLGTYWSFRARLVSRQFITRYGDIWDFVPEECRVLDDKEALQDVPSEEVNLLEKKFGLGVIQWNRTRYERAFDLVWQILRLHPEMLRDTTENAMSIARVGWVADLHMYLNGLDVGEPQTANLNWWKDLRPMFLGRFVDIADEQSVGKIGAIADAVQREYEITKDLEDDSFYFAVTLPGKVLRSNGERSERTIAWEIKGKTFQNDDAVMAADFFQLDYLQLSAGISILVVLIAWLAFHNRKQNRS